jgi:hypothetical protein
MKFASLMLGITCNRCVTLAIVERRQNMMVDLEMLNGRGRGVAIARVGWFRPAYGKYIFLDTEMGLWHLRDL